MAESSILKMAVVSITDGRSAGHNLLRWLARVRCPKGGKRLTASAGRCSSELLEYGHDAVLKKEFGLRILIADGDEVWLETAQRYLTHYGHEVKTARNGLEAVAGLRHDQPNVVVLERELLWGGSDGVRALMRKIPRWAEIPLILTSSDAIPDDSDSFTGPPVVARLQKPFRLQDLRVHFHACSLNGTQTGRMALPNVDAPSGFSCFFK